MSSLACHNYRPSASTLWVQGRQTLSKSRATVNDGRRDSRAQDAIVRSLVFLHEHGGVAHNPEAAMPSGPNPAQAVTAGGVHRTL
jgi:hypothetical protein